MKETSHEHEHEFEAAYGLPERLPAGEKLLWQGAPDWRALARDAMHIKLLAVYFAAMLLWRAGTAFVDGGGLLAALISIRFLLPLALLGLALLALFAWLVSKTSAYSITNKRVVMRVGIVLTVTFNLPFRVLTSAGLRRNADGSGDIALVLAPPDRIAYLHLWPHVRPWQIKRTQPMLRSIPDSLHVSELLVNAIAAFPVPGQSLERAVPERGKRPAAVAPAESAGPLITT